MDCSEVIIAKSVHSNRNTRPTVQCTAEKIYEHVHRKDLAKASSPCVRAGRQNLCFCIPIYPHFVPTAAERTRPSMNDTQFAEGRSKKWNIFTLMDSTSFGAKVGRVLRKLLGWNVVRVVYPCHRHLCALSNSNFFRQCSEPPFHLDQLWKVPTKTHYKGTFSWAPQSLLKTSNTHQEKLLHVLLNIFVQESEHGCT